MQLRGKKGFALIVINGEAEIAPYRYDGADSWMVKTARTPIWLRDYDEQLDVHFEGGSKGGIVALIHVVAVADREAALPNPKSISLPERSAQESVAALVQTEIGNSNLSAMMKEHCKDLFEESHIAASSYRLSQAPNDFSKGAADSLNLITRQERIVLDGMHDKITSTLNGGYRFG
jgi:hypothetical protein